MAYISLYFIIQNLIYYVCRVNISFVLRNIFLPLLLHRRKNVTHRSLHKTSLTNEEIPDQKIGRNRKILRINDFRGKRSGRVLYQK